jgi:hypothetical protein
MLSYGPDNDPLPLPLFAGCAVSGAMKDPKMTETACKWQSIDAAPIDGTWIIGRNEAGEEACIQSRQIHPKVSEMRHWAKGEERQEGSWKVSQCFYPVEWRPMILEARHRPQVRGAGSMRAQHTPGPWRLSSPGMVEMGAEKAKLSFWAGLGLGGTLPNPSGQEPRAELEANARLIAAAPDLLDALAAVLADIEEDIQWAATSDLERLIKRRERAELAIAKALAA